MKFHPLANLFPLISKDSLAVFFGIPTIIVTAEPCNHALWFLPTPNLRVGSCTIPSRRSQRALRRQRIRLVERVAELHHGIQEGHRIHAMLVMAPCLRGADNRERRVEDFNRRCCQPPLPATELEHVLKVGRRTIAFKDATLVKMARPDRWARCICSRARSSDPTSRATPIETTPRTSRASETTLGEARSYRK